MQPSPYSCLADSTNIPQQPCGLWQLQGGEEWSQSCSCKSITSTIVIFFAKTTMYILIHSRTHWIAILAAPSSTSTLTASNSPYLQHSKIINPFYVLCDIPACIVKRSPGVCIFLVRVHAQLQTSTNTLPITFTAELVNWIHLCPIGQSGEINKVLVRCYAYATWLVV